jgi:hypothetical protein
MHLDVINKRVQSEDVPDFEDGKGPIAKKSKVEANSESVFSGRERRPTNHGVAGAFIISSHPRLMHYIDHFNKNEN